MKSRHKMLIWGAVMTLLIGAGALIYEFNPTDFIAIIITIVCMSMGGIVYNLVNNLK